MEYPNGRSTVPVRYGSRDFANLLEVDFEQVAFLGDYEAMRQKDSGEIEALLRSTAGSSRFGRGVVGLARLPGVEILRSESTETLDDEDVDYVEEPSWRRPENWRLILAHKERDGVELEISPLSCLFETVLYGEQIRPARPISIKIRGGAARTSDEAVELLEDVANSFLFDLDLLHDLPIALATHHARERSLRRPRSDRARRFPLNRYPPEPLALYRYGRSAGDLPLLQFLAFYQSLEFFFSIYSREQSLSQLRTTLTDARFDPRSSSDLNKLLIMASPGARGFSSEKEQLRTTVRGCTNAVLLREFIESSERMTEHFCGKKQAIQGAQKLTLQSGSSDLRDQVADRIYAIRCRIVHTKQDGGDSGVDLLLPSSKESRSMGPDVALVRLVSERALAAQASSLRI